MLKIIFTTTCFLFLSSFTSAQLPFEVENTIWKGKTIKKIYEGSPRESMLIDPLQIEFINQEEVLIAIVTRSNSGGDPNEGTISQAYHDVVFDGGKTISLTHKSWIKKELHSIKKEVNISLVIQDDVNILKGELVDRSWGSKPVPVHLQRKIKKVKKNKKGKIGKFLEGIGNE